MDENTITLFQSKKTEHWQTPPQLFRALNREFRFDFDPCPLRPHFDGLKVRWKKRCFVNPPYSKVNEFLLKAHDELANGNTEVAVFLTFANTDTSWFHDLIYNKADEIRLIRGRIRFLDETGHIKGIAMRPSMISLFRSTKSKRSIFKSTNINRNSAA